MRGETDLKKTNDEPLMYYELHDEQDRKRKWFWFNIFFGMMFLATIGFFLTQHFQKPESVNELVQAIESPVGSDVKLTCTECVTKVTPQKAEDCNLNGLQKIIEEHGECVKCIKNMVVVEEKICKTLVKNYGDEKCAEAIGKLSKKDCGMSKENILEVVTKLEDKECEGDDLYSDVYMKVTLHCDKLGVNVKHPYDKANTLSEEEKMKMFKRDFLDMKQEELRRGEKGEGAVGSTPTNRLGNEFEFWDNVLEGKNCIEVDEFFNEAIFEFVYGDHIWCEIIYEFPYRSKIQGHKLSLGTMHYAEECKVECEATMSTALPYCYYNVLSGRCEIGEKWLATTSIFDRAFYHTDWSKRSNKGDHKDESGQYVHQGNAGTFRCADEGGFCACQGLVSYTPKCRSGTKYSFEAMGHGLVGSTPPCHRFTWDDLRGTDQWDRRNYQVRGGIYCTNGAFGRDVKSGFDKACWCHPSSHIGTSYGDDPPSQWSKEACKKKFAGIKGDPLKDFIRGALKGLQCTTECPLRIVHARNGRSVARLGNCSQSCWCVLRGWH